MPVTQSKAEIPTIDVELVTIQIGDQEFGFKTSNQVQVIPQVDTQKAVKLIVKGALLAQKGEVSTLTGDQIILTDNVFNPELVMTLQGGTITYDTTDTTKITGYTPPAAGSTEKGAIFTLNCYSTHYGTDGVPIDYEKISYPNCQGTPIAFSSQDGTFRSVQYTINSAPSTGQAPYAISYVDELPVMT